MTEGRDSSAPPASLAAARLPPQSAAQADFADKGRKRAGDAAQDPEYAAREQRGRAKIARNFRRFLRGRRGFRQGGKNAPLPAIMIIPKADIHGFALMAMIAIMSFLAAWTLFAAHFISLSALNWQAAIAREALVQIMPLPNQNMEADLQKAADIAAAFSGVEETHIVNPSETQALLAPWLGAKADIKALPVPRLIILRLSSDNPPDFEVLAAALQQNIAGVRFDFRQIWAKNLARGAYIMLGGAALLFILVLSAMILTIIFATGGALAGARPIIEVLHLIGADDNFIARQFDAHLFRTGLKGASLGGGAACGVFFLLYLGLNIHRATPEGSLMQALFGRLSADWQNLAEILLLIIFIAALTAAVGHITIIRRLRYLDKQSSSFFSAED